MDVNFIRKMNIQRLVEQAGGLRKFAEKVETDETYLSNLLSGKTKRNPGDELVRRIEQICGLPAGSLDFPDEKTQLAVMKLTQMPDAQRQASLDFIGYQYEQAHVSIADTPEKLAAYFRAIAKMIEAREKERRKKDEQ